MSNHDGSYLLNATLKLIDNYNFFSTLDKEKIESFVQEIFRLSWDFDCNRGEIFEDIGTKLGICYECGKFADILNHDICLKCMPK